MTDSGEKAGASTWEEGLGARISGWLRAAASLVGGNAQWHHIADEIRRKLRNKMLGTLMCQDRERPLGQGKRWRRYCGRAEEPSPRGGERFK